MTDPFDDILKKHQGTLCLKVQGSPTAAVHVFDQDEVWAIRCARAAQRPLLVRGEPGTGKSQLARAAAEALGLPLVEQVVDAHATCQDLLWRFDAVARLARAQALGARREVSDEDWRSALEERHFLEPGVLWWALHWRSAADHCKQHQQGDPPWPRPSGWTLDQGVVLLIDEIDKADSEVPNGLLEALGSGRFRVPHGGLLIVRDPQTAPPLVVITTNEERELPAAFVRRCLVVELSLDKDRTKALAQLQRRGQAHFPDRPDLGPVAEMAAGLVLDARAQVTDQGVHRPGLAEYLDLLRAVDQIARDRKVPPAEVLDRVQRFALCKQASGG